MEKHYRLAAKIKGIAMILAAVPFPLVLLLGLAAPPDREPPEPPLLASLVLIYAVQAITSGILAFSTKTELAWFRACAVLASLVSLAVIVAQFLPIGWFFAPYAWMPIVGILTAVGGLIADEWWLVFGGATAAIITPISAFLAAGHYWVPVVSLVLGVVWLFTGRGVPVSERIPRI